MIVLTDIVRQYFCLIMTLRDVWRGPVSWLMTRDNHRSHLQAITHRISPHHRLMILALSTLVSLASLHYYPGPGGSGVGWWARAAICLTWAIVTGLCLGIMSSARTKTHPEERERVEIQGAMAEWLSHWSECDSYYRVTMRRQGWTSAWQSFYHSNLCSFGTKSSELWARALWEEQLGDIQLSRLINNLLDLN